MTRKIVVLHNKIELTDNVETFFEKKVTRFGTGAKIDCPKEHIGKKVYVVIIKD